MNRSTLFLTLLGLGMVIIFDQVSGQSCKAIMGDMTKQQMSMMGKCTKSMKFKNAKDKAAKSMCVMKCVLKDVGMLNEAGKTDMDTFQKLAEKFFPNQSDRDHIVGVMGPCADLGASMDNEEEFCKSYDPFIKCLMGKMGNMCPPA